MNLSGASVSQVAFAINPTMNQSGTSSYTALLVNPTETATGSGNKFLADFQVGGTSKVAILSSGNVGIGTTTPAMDLTVTSKTASANSVIRIANDTTAAGDMNLEFYRNSSNKAGIGLHPGGGSTSMNLYDNHASGSISFSTGSTPTERMRINASGYVGIGTTAPSRALAVVGTTSVTSATQYDGSFWGNGTNTVADIKGTSATNDNGMLDLYNSGTKNVQIIATGNSYFTGGNLGIGTTAPSYVLDVAGNGGNITAIFGADNSATTRTDATQKTTRIGVPHYTNAEEPMALFYASSAGASNSITIGGGTALMNAATQISLYTAANNTTTSGTERMRIDSSGNVGIGIAPSAKMHIVGSDTSGLYVVNTASSASSGGAGIQAFMNGYPTAANHRLGFYTLGGGGGAIAGSVAMSAFSEEVWTAGSAQGSSLRFETTAQGSATRTERVRVTGSGNVGIGTTTPNALLQVAGTITGNPGVSNASTTIDFSTGNLQYTTANCQAYILHNVKDGGSYTFAVQGATAATCSFTAFSDAGTTALTVHLPPDHGATTVSKHTLYNLMNLGGHVYIAWTPGY